MEQHPVPQNVTTFQFRLVGDMTIKQFGYLAGGIIGGYLCYKLPLPFFFTWPLAIGAGLLGFGLAFVPVEERPMDIWIASFFKNVYNPTQYVWQKMPRTQSPKSVVSKPSAAAIVPVQPAPVSKRALTSEAASPRAPTTTSASPSITTMVARVLASLLAWIMPAAKTGAVTPGAHATRTPPEPAQLHVPVAPPAAPASRAVLTIHPVRDTFGWFRILFHGLSKPKPSLPAGYEFTDALAAAQTPSVVGKRLDMTPPQVPAVPAPATPAPLQPVVAAHSVAAPAANPATHNRMVELQGQLSESLAQRERLERELIALRQRVEQQAKAGAASPIRQAAVTQPSPSAPATTVRVIAPEAAAKAGLPRLTTFPNVVTGIVKDHFGNLLTGMLITVRDKNDMPLRALKTNRIGQFAASTPLSNDTYIVEIEDPKGAFIFDKVQIPLTGTVAPPIEVIAKSQKQVERDKLAREIFGNQPM